MNTNKSLKLIKMMNKYDIINITLNNIYYDELNIYDENEINKLKQFIKTNNIKDNELIYEFIIYYDDHDILKYYDNHDKLNDNIINHYLNNFNIKEFNNINLKSYNLIDYFKYNNQHEFIIEIFNINDNEFNDIINNILHH